MRKAGLKVLAIALAIVFSLTGAPMVMAVQASDVEIEELASELREALYEQGEAYLEILEEIRETTLAIEEDLQELKGMKMNLVMLDIDPQIRDTLINKLADIWSSIEEMNLLIREGRVVGAHGEIDEVILHLDTFIARVEIYRDKIGEDNAEILLERAEEIAEDARDWKETLKDLIPELEEILVEFDEAVREVQHIASELEALGAELEVTVKKQEKPMVTSAWITTTITAGGVTVKEASSCVTALKLEKPAISSLMGIFKQEILKHFEVETTLPPLDERLFPLIFPHTLGKLILIEGENPGAILSPRIIMEGIRDKVTARTIAQFLGLVTVERNVFRFIRDRFFPELGVGLVCLTLRALDDVGWE